MTQVAWQSDQAFSQLGKAFLPQFPLLTQVFSPRQRRLITGASSACKGEGKSVPKLQVMLSAGEESWIHYSEEMRREPWSAFQSVLLPLGLRSQTPVAPCVWFFSSLYWNFLVQIHKLEQFDLFHDSTCCCHSGQWGSFSSSHKCSGVEDAASHPLSCPSQFSWPFLPGLPCSPSFHSLGLNYLFPFIINILIGREADQDMPYIF